MSRVGPIIFSHETAREQLLEEGEVITFRKSQRTTGDTHARWERTGKKKADVHVEAISKVTPHTDSLDPFRGRSGFETVADWQQAIINLNGGELPEAGWLYRVTLEN